MKGAALYVLFVLLAAFGFSGRELWSDEVLTLMMIGGLDPAAIVMGLNSPNALGLLYDPAPGASLSEIWHHAATRDNHTPGYTMLFAVLFAAFEWLPADARTVQIINILLTGLFVFPALALMRAFGQPARWSTAAIVVFSPFAFYVAREMRFYGLLLALSLLAAWLVLRIEQRDRHVWAWLAGLVVVNVLGCLLHKLFLGVVAAELAYLGLAFLKARPLARASALHIAALAVTTAVSVVFIPNLLTTTPNIGGFDNAWFISSRDIVTILGAVATYLAYFVSWWVAPPEDLLGTVYGIGFIALFAPFVIWALILLVRAVARAPIPGVPVLFIVPLAMFLLLYLATGNDFSKAPRFSIIWVPLAAVWMIGTLPASRASTGFIAYAALATAVSSALVLSGLSHRSPDRARDFVQELGAIDGGRIIFIVDGSYSAGLQLLVLHSELARAGAMPDDFLVVDTRTPVQPASTANILAGPRRFAQHAGNACGASPVTIVGSFFACRAAATP